MIKLNIKVGDTILGGKWRNKKIEVKEIGKDDMGQPTINGKPILKFRIEKLMPKKKKVDESRKMNHLKIYEDFRPEDQRLKDPKIGELGNKYLGNILRKEIKFELIDPRKGEFYSDFDDTEGSTEAELTWGFQDENNKDSHIAIEFTWYWRMDQSTVYSDPERINPPEGPTPVLTDIDLNSVYFYSDGGDDGDFEITQENKKLLQDYLERMLPTEKIKNFKL